MKRLGLLVIILLAASFPVLTADPSGKEQEPDLEEELDLDYAQVLYVRAVQNEAGSWTFHATVRHKDEGWDHYADLWQVITPEGEILGERVLLHPHDNEQPFTRSQSGIQVPGGLERVVVRAKCNVHGYGGRSVVVDFSQVETEEYLIEPRP